MGISNIQVEYFFHPVGQGLFSSGRVHFVPHESFDFRWVYDCGTTSSQRLLRDARSNFKRHFGSDRLDLIVISHFDADHISGIVDLLNEVGTDTLMLPWAGLWHRLMIGCAQGLSPEDPDFEFYIDPVRYFEDRAGEGFRRIVFVPFSNGEGPPEPEGEPEPKLDPDVESPLEFDADKEYKDDRLGGANEWMEYVSNVSGRHEVSMMRRGGSASVLGLWEFVPYNDPATRPKSMPDFLLIVERLREDLLRTSNSRREQALETLKEHYARSFPKSQRNDLSLFLYGGPIGRWGTYVQHWFPAYFSGQAHNGSVIYTGDGSLATEEKWQTFADYLHENRTTQIAVFQVPHHGSRNNWYDGLADRIEPLTSVFSSDPSHRSYGHPHSEVVRDFWPHCPVQVDKERAFFMQVDLWRP